LHEHVPRQHLKAIEHQGQRSSSQSFFCFCVHNTAWTSWPGFTKCCTNMARGQYLALSKSWRSRFILILLGHGSICKWAFSTKSKKVYV